jgi:hypothetical protein
MAVLSLCCVSKITFARLAAVVSGELGIYIIKEKALSFSSVSVSE